MAEIGVAKPAGHVTLVRGPVTIAPDGAWTDAAATWPWHVVSRETLPPADGEEGRKLASDFGVYEVREPLTQVHAVCSRCPDEPSVLCLDPGGEPYRVQVVYLLAGILAHLRRSHPDA